MRSKRSKHESSEIEIPPVHRDLAAHVNALNRMIHEPVRLFILLLLEANKEGISFKQLQAETNLNSGNLSVQAGKLERAGYITVTKAFQGRRPATHYRITPDGQAAWETYWGHMNFFLRVLAEMGGMEQPHGPGVRWVGRGAAEGQGGQEMGEARGLER